MQELNYFNGQESLNPALMLTLGVGAIPIAVTLHSILLLPWSWCINATDASISSCLQSWWTKKIRFVMETQSQPHQKGQADVSPKGETNPSMWHFAGTSPAQRWISKSSCQEPESLCVRQAAAMLTQETKITLCNQNSIYLLKRILKCKWV